MNDTQVVFSGDQNKSKMLLYQYSVADATKILPSVEIRTTEGMARQP